MAPGHEEVPDGINQFHKSPYLFVQQISECQPRAKKQALTLGL